MQTRESGVIREVTSTLLCKTWAVLLTVVINYTPHTSTLMAVHQLRTAALQTSLAPQEERVNLSGGREKGSKTSWAELPIKAKSAIRREKLEQTGP